MDFDKCGPRGPAFVFVRLHNFEKSPPVEFRGSGRGCVWTLRDSLRSGCILSRKRTLWDPCGAGERGLYWQLVRWECLLDVLTVIRFIIVCTNFKSTSSPSTRLYLTLSLPLPPRPSHLTLSHFRQLMYANRRHTPSSPLNLTPLSCSGQHLLLHNRMITI